MHKENELAILRYILELESEIASLRQLLARQIVTIGERQESWQKMQAEVEQLKASWNGMRQCGGSQQ